MIRDFRAPLGHPPVGGTALGNALYGRERELHGLGHRQRVARRRGVKDSAERQTKGGAWGSDLADGGTWIRRKRGILSSAAIESSTSSIFVRTRRNPDTKLYLCVSALVWEARAMIKSSMRHTNCT